MKIRIDGEVYRGTALECVEQMRDNGGPFNAHKTIEEFSRTLIENLRDCGVEVDPPWQPLEDRCRIIIEASILAGLTERIDDDV